MKAIVEGMGLDWKSQYAKLQGSRFGSTMAEITTVAEDGKRRLMSCLPLRKLPGWLMIIAMMDAVHGRPDGTARKRFNDHRGKLERGRHFWTIFQPSEIRTLGLARKDGGTPPYVHLLSERGHLVLVKSFTDDLASTTTCNPTKSGRKSSNLKGLR